MTGNCLFGGDLSEGCLFGGDLFRRCLFEGCLFGWKSACECVVGSSGVMPVCQLASSSVSQTLSL